MWLRASDISYDGALAPQEREAAEEEEEKEEGGMCGRVWAHGKWAHSTSELEEGVWLRHPSHIGSQRRREREEREPAPQPIGGEESGAEQQ